MERYQAELTQEFSNVHFTEESETQNFEILSEPAF